MKIGIIGCGFMGSMHMSCYKEIEGVKVTAVADIRRDKAEELVKGTNAKIYGDGEELIKCADVDAVDICLPTYLHTKYAVDAMKKVKNVFIEKPVCLTKQEGETLLRVQKETGANVQVGLVIRFWAEYAALYEIVKDNRYGKVQAATFRRISAYPDWSWDNWLHQFEKSGTVAHDMYVHDVDFIRYTFGLPNRTVPAVVRDQKGDIQHIFAQFCYDNAVITAESAWDLPKEFPFTAGFCVKFEAATVVNDESGFSIYPKEGGVIKPELHKFEGQNEAHGNISSLGGYYNELKSFVQTINRGGKIEKATLGEAVLSNNFLLDIIENTGGANRAERE